LTPAQRSRRSPKGAAFPCLALGAG